MSLVIGGKPYVLAMPFAQCWKNLLDYESGLIVSAVNIQKPYSKLTIAQQAITANTNIISTDISKQLQPNNPPCIFRIYVVLGTTGIFSVQRRAGNTQATENLNAGNALTANAAYIFDIIVDQNEYIDFQSTATGTLLKLSVVEKDDAK